MEETSDHTTLKEILQDTFMCKLKKNKKLQKI